MKTISVVFHPLLIATYLTTILLFKAPELLPQINPQVIPQFLLMVFLITTAMPAFSVLLMRTFKYISDLELSNRSERLMPFGLILFYYIAASYLFIQKLELFGLFAQLILSVTILIFILLLITTRFKISIHAAAIWCFVGYLTTISIFYLAQFGWFYYAFVLAAGLTSTSRLYLGQHSHREVLAGSLLGFSYGFSVLLFPF